MRRVWEPTSANESSNRPEEPAAQPTANAPTYERDGIEVRAVRSIGLGRMVWIAKRAPWEESRCRSIWMAIGTVSEMGGWAASSVNAATPPTFAQTYGRRTNEKANARHRGR